MNASKLGQQIRWVRQYNEATARACRNQGWKKPGYGVVRNRRPFRRHWMKAWRLKEKHNLTTIMLVDIPPANVPHSEPDYDNAIPQDWLDEADTSYERVKQSNK